MDPWDLLQGLSRAARLRERHPLTGRELDAALEQLERRARLVDELEELQILSSDGAVVDQASKVTTSFQDREPERSTGIERSGLVGWARGKIPDHPAEVPKPPGK